MVKKIVDYQSIKSINTIPALLFNRLIGVNRSVGLALAKKYNIKLVRPRTNLNSVDNFFTELREAIRYDKYIGVFNDIEAGLYDSNDLNDLNDVLDNLLEIKKVYPDIIGIDQQIGTIQYKIDEYNNLLIRYNKLRDYIVDGLYDSNDLNHLNRVLDDLIEIKKVYPDIIGIDQQIGTIKHKIYEYNELREAIRYDKYIGVFNDIEAGLYDSNDLNDLNDVLDDLIEIKKVYPDIIGIDQQIGTIKHKIDEYNKYIGVFNDIEAGLYDSNDLNHLNRVLDDLIEIKKVYPDIIGVDQQIGTIKHKIYENNNLLKRYNKLSDDIGDGIIGENNSIEELNNIINELITLNLPGADLLIEIIRNIINKKSKYEILVIDSEDPIEIENSKIYKVPYEIKNSLKPILSQEFVGTSRSKLGNDSAIINNKPYKYVEGIYSNDYFSGYLVIDITYTFSEPTYAKIVVNIKKNEQYTVNSLTITNANLIKELIIIKGEGWFYGNKNVSDVRIDEIQFLSDKDSDLALFEEYEYDEIILDLGFKMNYDGFILKRQFPTILDERFCIKEYPIIKEDNCFYDLCKHIFGKKGNYQFKKNTFKSFKELINEHKFNLRAWDITTKQICELDNSSKKVIDILLHNEHIYLLGKKPSSIFKSKEIKICNNINMELKSFLDKNIEPYNISITNRNIVTIDDKNYPSVYSFSVNDITYTNNEDFEICREILKKLEISANEFTTKGNLIDIIARKFGSSKLKSYFQYSSRYCKGGYTYKNGIESYDNIYTTDMSKAYVKSLRDLPFLIICDRKRHEVKNYTGELLQKHYLYNVIPKLSSLLLPDSNLYSGDHLLNCIKNGIDFDIIEYIETDKEDNIYKELIDMINDKFIYDENYKFIMQSFVIHIGKMSTDNTNNTNTRICFDRIACKSELICNGEELKGYKINEDSYVTYNDKNCKSTISNMKPISIQVYDNCRLIINDYLIKNNIESKDILQIKTDSITTIDKPLEISVGKDKLFGGFKEEKFKPLQTTSMYSNNLVKLNDHRKIKGNYLNLLPAGGGKTYAIKELIKTIKGSYVILSQTHKALSTYRTDKINCKILCCWTEDDEINGYDNIIVDEVGMISDICFDKLISATLSGIKLYCFGDFTQLPAVGTDSLKTPKLYGKYCEEFMKFIFETIILPDKFINYRNDFTYEYYQDILNNKIDPLKEVIKHSTSFGDAEYVLTWTRKTRDLYNYKKLESLGYKNIEHIKATDFGYNTKNNTIKGFCQKGVKIISDLIDHKDSKKTNNVKDYGIYNSCVYTITDIKDDEVTLDDNIIIPKKSIEKYFIPAYAINIYKCQGQTISSYHWAVEDNEYLVNNDMKNIISYVIISRLKTK